MKRLAFAGLLLLCLGAALFLLRNPSGTSEIRLTGIVSANEAFVASELSGRLKEMRVNEGDRVEKGQVVAVLATEEIDALRQSKLALINELTARLDQGRERVHLERERVKSQIDSATAQLSAAENQREEVRAELQQARQDVDRMTELFAEGLVPHQRVERQETIVDVAEAKLESANDRVEAAAAELEMHRASERQVKVMEREVQQTQAQVEQARADLAQITVRRGYTELKSPLTGTVSLRVAREGEFVSAGSPVLTIVDLNDVWVRAEVEETFVSRLVIGQPLPVILASEERLVGQVTFISPEAEFATQRDVSRVKRDIRTFGIKVALQNPSGRVHPGMTAFVLLPSEDASPLPLEKGEVTTDTALPAKPPEVAKEQIPASPAGAAMAAPAEARPQITTTPAENPKSVAAERSAKPKVARTQNKPAVPVEAPPPVSKPTLTPPPAPEQESRKEPETPSEPAPDVKSPAPPVETEPEASEELSALEEILADIELETPMDPDARRILLEELRGAAPRPELKREATPPAAATEAPAPKFRLEGISVSDGKPVAVVNGVRVFVGDMVNGARVKSIAGGAVELELDGQTITLRF